jgi:hypothetical protein
MNLLQLVGVISVLLIDVGIDSKSMTISFDNADVEYSRDHIFF